MHYSDEEITRCEAGTVHVVNDQTLSESIGSTTEFVKFAKQGADGADTEYRLCNPDESLHACKARDAPQYACYLDMGLQCSEISSRSAEGQAGGQ